MIDLTLDQTEKALAKARSKYTREHGTLVAAQDDALKKDAAVGRAESALDLTLSKLREVEHARGEIDMQARNADPDNDPALRRLGADRANVEVRRLALEGAKEREQAALKQAKANVIAAHEKVETCEKFQAQAKFSLSECEHDAEEARLLAAGQPFPRHLADRRKAREQRAEEDRLRRVGWVWAEVTERWPEVSRGQVFPHDEHDRQQQRLFDVIWARRYGGKVPAEEPKATKASEPAAVVQLKPGETKWRAGSATAPLEVSTPKIITGDADGEWSPFSDAANS